ncbi:hypothetical protein HDU97_000916 [Phlyctochytrium planicorne]|nr:hypothetical protein HDU97_000916 [Phlyctochytrium planicorne]
MITSAGLKFACLKCQRGHRANACSHTDRALFPLYPGSDKDLTFEGYGNGKIELHLTNGGILIVPSNMDEPQNIEALNVPGACNLVVQASTKEDTHSNIVPAAFSHFSPFDGSHLVPGRKKRPRSDNPDAPRAQAVRTTSSSSLSSRPMATSSNDSIRSLSHSPPTHLKDARQRALLGQRESNGDSGRSSSSPNSSFLPEKLSALELLAQMPFIPVGTMDDPSRFHIDVSSSSLAEALAERSELQRNRKRLIPIAPASTFAAQKPTLDSGRILGKRSRDDMLGSNISPTPTSAEERDAFANELLRSRFDPIQTSNSHLNSIPTPPFTSNTTLHYASQDLDPSSTIDLATSTASVSTQSLPASTNSSLITSTAKPESTPLTAVERMLAEGLRGRSLRNAAANSTTINLPQSAYEMTARSMIERLKMKYPKHDVDEKQKELLLEEVAMHLAAFDMEKWNP